MSDLDPFRFSEYEGSHSVILTDIDMLDVMEVFDEHGYSGNGYGWAGVAQSAVVHHAPDLDALVRYDPEAGMFAASSTDRVAVERLAVLLHKAFHDRVFLAELIAAGQPEWFD